MLRPSVKRCAALLLASLCLTFAALFPPACACAYEQPPFPVGPGEKLLLMEPSTGTVIYAQNEHERVPVASITKVMTLLIAFEMIEAGELSLDDEVTISRTAAATEGSEAFLDAGASYPLSDLIRTMIIASANDSSVAVAEHIAGSESAFTEMMNARAAELGMVDTVFKTCTGLPAEGQFSCAADVAAMSRELLTHPLYFTWSGTWMDTLVHPGGRETELTNTNRLVRFYSGADGVKTGYSREAGCCVSASAEKGGMRLIAVALGYARSVERFGRAEALLDYGFDSYTLTTVTAAGQTVREGVRVIGGRVNKTDLVAVDDIKILSRKGTDAAYTVEEDLPDAIFAPLSAGARVGCVTVTMSDGSRVVTDVTTSHEGIDSSVIGMMLKIFSLWA